MECIYGCIEKVCGCLERVCEWRGCVHRKDVGCI